MMLSKGLLIGMHYLSSLKSIVNIIIKVEYELRTKIIEYATV